MLATAAVGLSLVPLNKDRAITVRPPPTLVYEEVDKGVLTEGPAARTVLLNVLLQCRPDPMHRAVIVLTAYLPRRRVPS